MIRDLIKQFKADASGGVGVLVGLSLPVVIGSVGLAFDLNRGLEQRIINQRAADMAALGAAMAYKAADDEAVLQPTATDLARANGLSGATVNAVVVNDLPNAGDKSVQVTITAQLPYTLARVVGMSGNYGVTATSMVSLETQAQYAAPCFLALSDGADALITQGGASIDAPDCSIAAVGSIDNGGNTITAHDIISGSGDISTGWGSLVAETLRFAGTFSAKSAAVPSEEHRFNQTTELVDPWAEDAELIDARDELGDFTIPTTLSDPNTNCSGAENWSLEWSPKNNNPAKAYWNGSGGYNIPAGTYCIKKLTVGGGITVKFANGSDISVSDGFSNGGNAVDFGNSDLRVNGGFDSGWSGVTIGNGLLWIGHGKITFSGTNRKGDGDVIINDTVSFNGGQNFTVGAGQHSFGALKFGGGGWMAMGDGDLMVQNGIDVGANSELSMGNGDIVIGSDGKTAIKLAGSGRFFMGDGEFSANGDIDTNGGSLLVFGRTNNHYINGDMKISGAVLFGAGRYTVNGDFWNGTGGTTWPYTSPVTGTTYGPTLAGVSVSGFDMVGVDVTFILAGTFDLAGGARTKFVAADTTTSGGAIANLLVDSLTDDNIDWTGGSTNVFDGTVHFPNAAVKMAGGNSTGGGGGCFTLIASYIKLTGGAVAGSACPEMSTGSSGSSSEIRLIR